MEFVAWYGYDVFNRRISKSTLEEETYYSYDGGTLVEEYDGGFGDRLAYFNGVGQDEHLGMAVYDGQAWARYSFVTDKLGSLVRVVDNQGTVVARYEYDPYGRRTLVSGSLSFKIAHSFIGRYHDDETNLLYVRNRYYSPEFGRFLTQDPSGSWFDISNWGNGLAYGMANPLGTLDRNGKFFGLGILAMVAIAVAVGAVVGAVVGGAVAAATDGDIATGAIEGAIIGAAAGLGAMTGGAALAGVAAPSVGAQIGAVVIGAKGSALGSLMAGVVLDRERLSKQSPLQNAKELGGKFAFEMGLGIAAGGVAVAGRKIWCSVFKTKNTSAGPLNAPKPPGQGSAGSSPKPPGWTPEWTWEPSTRTGSKGWRWFDEAGGEWRFHDVDKWHPEAHWDYNPWTEWNSPWTNVDK